jgi:hypothetical protein
MADVERERVTALWREAAAAVETPRCTCTEDELSDGSATYEDDPHCPIHGWCSWRAECGRLRERLDALTKAVVYHIENEIGEFRTLRAALGVEGEQEKPT